MYRAALLIGILALAAACGSDGDESVGTTRTTETVSAADVESALGVELSQGGSGIVNLERGKPQQVTCEKESGSAAEWRCTVTPSKSGESYVCFVEVDPQTKRTTKATCGRVDN
jgi:hypothetical protein